MDVNRDGLSDLILAYNFYGNRPFFGQNDAGVGDVLINQNGESFELLETAATGLDLRGNIREIELIGSGDTVSLLIATNNDSLRIQKLKTFK